MEILDKYLMEHGIITNKEAEQLGIKRHVLANLVKIGELERIKRGVYKKRDDIEDDFALISSKNEKVVFSYQTALFLLGLSDRCPNISHISVSQGYNINHIKKKYENIKAHYVKKEKFEIGMIDIKTPMGNKVKVYDMERCICDIVLSREKIDRPIFIDAITRYFASEQKNIRRLIKYSRMFAIESEIRKYMEVLE